MSGFGIRVAQGGGSWEIRRGVVREPEDKDRAGVLRCPRYPMGRPFGSWDSGNPPGGRQNGSKNRASCASGEAVVGSLAMPKRREKIIDEGDAKIIYDYAPSPDEGLDLAREILSECPEGYHPWRVQVQKSDRGRRSSVRVWFKRSAPRGEAP